MIHSKSEVLPVVSRLSEAATTAAAVAVDTGAHRYNSTNFLSYRIVLSLKHMLSPLFILLSWLLFAPRRAKRSKLLGISTPSGRSGRFDDHRITRLYPGKIHTCNTVRMYEKQNLDVK